MKVPNISTGQAQIVIGLAGVAVAIYAIYQVKSGVTAVGHGTSAVANYVKDKVGAVGGYIADDKNVVNGAAVSMVGKDRLQGGFDSIFDFFHPDLKEAREKANNVKGYSAKVMAPPIKTGAIR